MTLVLPERIRQVVADLRLDCRQPADPTRCGPVLLDRFFDELNLTHVALPVLTRRTVRDYLRAEGVAADGADDTDEPLAGFLVVAGRVGWAFVAAADPLPRRRFTAAHELGHFVLHRAVMGRFRADTPEMLREADDEEGEALEREANRFAAELLMPAEVCRARADVLRRDHDCCPRGVLAYRLASELLVSREAIRYRLQALGVGDD